jgi:hypothetical protein
MGRPECEYRCSSHTPIQQEDYAASHGPIEIWQTIREAQNAVRQRRLSCVQASMLGPTIVKQEPFAQGMVFFPCARI